MATSAFLRGVAKAGAEKSNILPLLKLLSIWERVHTLQERIEIAGR